MALENANSQCALGELTSPESDLRLLVEKGLAIRDIATLLVDEQGALWLGNAWGLHCWRGTGEPESFDLENKQVRALAEAVGGGLWLGTNWGLYRFQVGGELLQAPDWTREEIFSLAIDSETGDLWAVTATGVGRIADGSWQSVSQAKSPPGQLTKAIALPSTLKPRFGEGTVFVGGANGLYLTNIDSSEPAFTGSDEDTLSNAVHCLWADETTVWIGTARGLHRFDGKAWRSYGADAPNLRDVRTLLPDGEEGRLWVGTFRIGLQRIEQGVYIPDSVLKTPIISLTASPDGTLWAATFDAIYCRPSGQKDWQLILHPAEEHIGQGLIQAMALLN
jgi:ligand-binding sensor domain-containing protein